MSSKREKWTGRYQSDSAVQRNQFMKNKMRSLYHLANEFSHCIVFGGKDLRDFKVPLDKPIFYGNRYTAAIKPYALQRYPELKEVADVAAEWVQFSGNEARRCNLKEYNIRHPEYLNLLFVNKFYQRGKLNFHSISEESFNKLSDAAKKWFHRYPGVLDWRGERTYYYAPCVPSIYVKNVCVPYFVTALSVDDSETRRKEAEIRKMTHDAQDIYWYWGRFNSDYWGTKDTRRTFRHRERQSMKNDIKLRLEEYFEEDEV